MLEYAIDVLHSGPTQDQSSVMEAVQKRVMRIIYGVMSYKDACHFAKLLPFATRATATSDRQEQFYQMQDSNRTFYIIYSHQYNVIRLDILSRVKLFALTQTDLKSLLSLML